MTRRSVIVWILLAMAVAGCSTGPRHAQPTLPEAGQCIAKEASDLDTFAPNFASVVNCKRPHVYEIVDALTVPQRFLVKGSRSKKLRRRNELVKSTATGAMADDFHAYADRGCRRSVLKATGLDAVNINGLSALDAGVQPVLIGATTSAGVDSANQWASGSPRIVCSMRYTDPVSPGAPAGQPSAIRSSSSLPEYRSLLSTTFPAGRRACASYDSDNYLYAVLCTNQHNVEVLFSYDARAVFGKDFVKHVGLNPTDAEWDQLVTPCEVMLPNVVGEDVGDDLDGSAYVADDWDLPGSGHKTYCLITPDAEHVDFAPGSVVGRAGHIAEVPAKKGKPLVEQSTT